MVKENDGASENKFTGSLADEVMRTAIPRLPELNGLTTMEAAEVSAQAEGVARLEFKKLGPDDKRGSFTISTDVVRGLNGNYIVNRFKGNPMKQQSANKLAKQLLGNWQDYIRMSELFALIAETHDNGSSTEQSG